MKRIIFTILILLIVSCSTKAQQSWQPLGGGANLEVFAFTVYNGDLIVAGIFDTVGTMKSNRIARWNGSSWSALGSGTAGGLFDFGIVRCLTVYNGDLIAGGYFDTAGGIRTPGIAKWNGTVWSGLGDGVGGSSPYVEALTIFNNELIVGGAFTLAGGNSSPGIARWNGTAWNTLGTGISPPDASGVYSLAVYANQLVAGGDFQQAGGVGTNLIAKWNGTTWSTLATGIQGNLVKSLIPYGGQLVAGGAFFQAGTVAANNIARWNGTTWTTLGTGTNSDVYAMQVIGADLYVGGLFTFCGGTAVNKIARWNGTTWFPLGTGSNNGVTPGGVSALGNFPVTSAVLVVGGSFSTAGGLTARKLAQWGDFTGLESNNNEIPKDYALEQNYPNPFNPETKIDFSLPKNVYVTLSIYDESGKKIDALIDGNLPAGKYSFNWSPKELSSGVYFYRMEAGAFIKTMKMSFVK